MKRVLFDLVSSLTDGLKIENAGERRNICNALLREAENNPSSLQIPSLALVGLNAEGASESLIEEFKGSEKDVLPVVARREIPFHLPIRAEIPVFRGKSMRIEQTLGPFTGPGGIAYWYDIFYRPLSKYEVWKEGGTLPLFVLTGARLPRLSKSRLSKSGYKLTVSEGTVWVLASLLDNNAPAGAYTGFSAREGSFKLKEVPHLNDRKLVISHPLDAELKLTLLQPKAPEGKVCQATSDVITPESIEIHWQHGEPSHINIGPGEATLYQQKFQFSRYLGNVRYINNLEIVLFEFSVEPTAWDGSSLDSPLLTISGTTKINVAGWILPIVTVSNADELGEAGVGGYWLLDCFEGLQASWLGSHGKPAELKKTYLVLDDKCFILASAHAHAEKPGRRQRIKLWSLSEEDAERRLPFSMIFGEDFPLVFISDGGQGDLLYVMGRGNVQLDRPLDLNGQPVKFSGGIGLIQLQAKNGTIHFYSVVLRAGLLFSGTPSLATEPISLALQNAVLKLTKPAAITVRGYLVGQDRMDSGKLNMAFGVFCWMPILPDPYVANFSSRRKGNVPGENIADRITGVAICGVDWEVPTDPAMSFEGLVGLMLCITGKSPTPIDPRGISKHRCPIYLPSTQTSQGQVSMTDQEVSDLKKAQHVALDKLRKNASERLTENTQKLTQLRALFSRIAPGVDGGIRLLDVSTNQDLIGVQIEPSLRGQFLTDVLLSSQPTGTFFWLKGMDVIIPAFGIQVFTLPQIQWEPVRTLPVDQDLIRLGYFPTPLASATDGGATVVAVPSQTLVPMIPEVLVKSQVNDYRDGNPAAMVTTLPFGLKSVVALRTGWQDGRAPDSFNITQPEFAENGMRGGVQLTMQAESGAQHRNEQSAYFEGATLQLLNGVDIYTGEELGISVLGGTNQPESTVESFFNNEFAPGGAFPRVPVTRFDISGYGGSNFSNWENPLGQFAQATKVTFNVIVGRTAMEVVKVATVLYPWGIKLTRSITIERRGGGGVIRRDSGWEATSPGIFDFRYTDETNTKHPSPYTFHPGLIRGLFKVTNLRPAAGPIIKFTGDSGDQVELAPQYFDADIEIEGLDADGAKTVFAAGILGFLQIKPYGKPLSPGDLKHLIQLQSAIGGPLDCIVNVARAGLRIRALRLEVDVAEGATPSFVGVVRGMPRFRQSGAWSVIRQAGPGNSTSPQEAITVDDVGGLPVIRAQELEVPNGDVMRFKPGAGPYRFADARDLLQPNNPDFDYGFLQTSPAHSLLFKRLYIDKGIHVLRSNLKPLFADVFARFTSKSLFPPQTNAIELALNTLVINPTTGGFHLNTPVNMTAPRAPLDLSVSGSDRMQLAYNDVSLSVDVRETGWSVDLQKLHIWADFLGLEKFSGTTYRILGSDTTRPQLQEIKTHLHKDFEKALEFIPNFSNRGILGPIDLDATNAEHEFKILATLKWGIPDQKVGPLKLTASTEVTTTYSAVLVGAELSFKFDAPPYPPVTFIILGLKFGASFKTFYDGSDKTTNLKLMAYVGYGAGKRIGPFSAEAFLAIGPVLVIEDVGGSKVVKFGGIVFMDANVDFEVVSVNIGASFQGLFYDDPVTCHGTAVDYGGEVYINITIFWIFSIEASYSISETDCI
jgi:hypothetical protein